MFLYPCNPVTLYLLTMTCYNKACSSLLLQFLGTKHLRFGKMPLTKFAITYFKNEKRPDWGVCILAIGIDF
ncbi:hypothetical protein THIAE_02755 [Thiomicrospira aerophila AL3]|uniref:Uncharacterized protein n=1 Tax=Thiomicrospira aerophila AL3 TaxID=717772 RepID=W0DUG5_9GAMM|nr:hypothetical protein THIAE_02755 [Thiomicrospira aerophila AL3]